MQQQAKTGIRLQVDPDKIRASRVAAFMTIRELAEKSGVGISTVERLERGNEPVGVRYATITPIAKALSVGVDALLDDRA